MGCSNGRGRGAVRAGGRLPFAVLVCGGVALNAMAPVAAIDFNGSESAGDAVIDNTIDGVNFNDQSTAGNATINNSFSGLTFFNDQSTAGNATIRSENGGATIFTGQSSAGNALIVSGEEGGTFFTGSSNGGTARLVAEDSGFVDFTEVQGPAGGGRFTVGSIEGNGSFEFGSAVVAVGSNNLDTQVIGSLSGDVDGTLIKIGSGTLTVRGENANSFASAIRIEGGLINFDEGASLGSGGIVLDGGGLQWADNSSFDISPRIDALGAAGGTFDTNGNDVLLSGAIGGSGSLTKVGAGVLVLQGAASYSGATIVQAGTLRQGSAGGFVQNGAYVINGGALDLNSVGLSMGSLSGSGGQVLLGSADLVVDQALDTSYAGSISGSGGFSKLGAGLLLLEGSNDYSGLTQVSGGTLRQGGVGAFVAGGSYLVSGGVLDLNGFDLSMSSLSGCCGEVALGGGDLTLVQASDSSFSGVISGSGGLIKQGAGTLTLSGNNSYSGVTRVDAGTLRQDSAGGLVSGGAYELGGGVLDLGGFDLSMSALIGGSGQVALGGATLTVDQASNTSFAGSILGSGAFIKDGAGTLDLGGSHGIAGITEVRGGTLAVNGSLLSAIQVQSGATLSGTGSVGNLLIDAGGTLAPGNSIGTLNVDGDLVFGPNSVYQVETDAAGNADRVVVSGLASLAGAVQVLAENGSYAPSTSYNILSAGQLSGQFDSVSSNLAFLTPSLSYEGNAVTLTLARNDTSFTSLARTPNQRAFAEAAERLDEDNEVYRTLLDLGEDEVADTFNKLSGDAHASIASSVLFDDLNLSRAPLGNLRRNLASPERALPYWVQVGGGRQRIDDDGNAGEIIQDHESMLLGGDWPVYGDWRLGGAFGFGQERLDVNSRDAKADSDSYRYALYGGRDVALTQGTLKIFGGGGYSQHQIDSRRDVRLIDGPERLTRQYDVNTAQGFGELAWHLKFSEPAYVEPFVGLLLIDQRSDSFSEKGGAAALSASSQRNELLSTSLGVRGQQLFQVAERDLLLNGSFTWRQINGDLRPELDLQLEGGDRFRVLGTELPRNSFLVELNADYSITPNIVLDIDYNGVFSDRSNASNIAFNLRWKM